MKKQQTMEWELKKGSAVEISSNEDGFRGAWFEGTVISNNLERGAVLVEYKTLTSDDSDTPLQEWVDPLQLRPLPPPDNNNNSNNNNNKKNNKNEMKFEMSDEVDAWYNDGWWEGVVTQVLVDSGSYAVFFRGTREQIVFPFSLLRLHREWISNSWHPPPPSETPQLSTEIEKKCYKKGRVVFGEEMLVEVSSDEDGFQGAWFAATIIKKTKGGDKYLIEYKSLRNDDDTDFLREEADALHIRPYPPDTIMVDRFNLHEEVDALYNDGWWVGVISKVLNDGRYVVYFRTTDEEMKFNHSELRIHQEWVNDTWIVSSRGLEL